jgi:hypothetical protein
MTTLTAAITGIFSKARSKIAQEEEATDKEWFSLVSDVADENPKSADRIPAILKLTGRTIAPDWDHALASDGDDQRPRPPAMRSSRWFALRLSAYRRILCYTGHV